VIDLSLSAAARGRIMVAARDNQPIPEGWALDRDGKPTTDARAALEGTMLPSGGVKGAMLALTVELLVCALTGSAFGFESDSFFEEEGRPTRIGQAFMAIDPGALAGQDVFYERVETLVAAMTEDPAVRLPGDRRRQNRERAAAEGLEIPGPLLARIRSLAGEPPMPDTHAVSAFQACVRTPVRDLGHHDHGDARDRHPLPGSDDTRAHAAAQFHRAPRVRAAQSYLDNPKFAFDLPLLITGTRHRIAVWEAMQRIPAGSTLSYGRSPGRWALPREPWGARAARTRSPS
jgi:(2R)-3-sulfolactate dehydrogenase (NADP+)